MAEDIPVWKKNKSEYNKKYFKENYKRININLNQQTEQEFIDIYESIPNKREWFKECLLRYRDEQ